MAIIHKNITAAADIHNPKWFSDANNGDGLRKFLYSNGPRWLTTIERIPDVKEVTNEI